jgi:hypothetical protein
MTGTQIVLVAFFGSFVLFLTGLGLIATERTWARITGTILAAPVILVTLTVIVLSIIQAAGRL